MGSLNFCHKPSASGVFSQRNSFEAAVAEDRGIIVVVNLSKVKPGLRNEGPVRFAVCRFPFVSCH